MLLLCKSRDRFSMKPHPSVLVIDDDRHSRRYLRHILESSQYRVFEAENARLGLEEAAGRTPDIIIMELSLPDAGGVVFVCRLREWNRAHILILSSNGAEDDKIQALDAGANDYMTKPFNPGELLARLRVMQRSNPAEADGPVFVYGNVKVDLAARLVTLGGARIDLTPTEQAIFYTLLRHAGLVVSVGHLCRCVWGADNENNLANLHVCIANLRQKLREPSGRILIKTAGTTGYEISVPASEKFIDSEIDTAPLWRLPDNLCAP